jgi:hypothetical protein
MMKNLKKVVAYVLPVGAMLPSLAFAQANAWSILGVVQSIFNVLIPLLITLGVIYFIWGVIKYITAKDEGEQAEARKVMVSGIIGLFVIVAIWGLVGVITNTFGVGAQNAPTLPCIDNPSIGIEC